jgi:hypothetical protein
MSDAARERFDAAAERHLTAPLADGVEIRHVTYEEVTAASDGLWADDARPHARLDVLYTEEQRARLGELNALFPQPLAHRLVFVEGGEVIGSYWGVQETWGRYYMVNTIFRRDRQGRGLYRALLPRVVAAAADAGFTEVYSRHRADNNAILIPKMKAGFTIAAFEVAPRFGMLVHLRRYLVPALDQMFRHRIDGAFSDELRERGAIK